MTPKYKVGDTVRLRPWSDLEDHSGIPMLYWKEVTAKDLEILHVRIVEGKIYYNFSSVLFAWDEKFIIQPSANFLSDKDFEI